jgi:hypothetical protein
MNCVFCNKELNNGQPTVKIRDKGCDTINEISSSLNNNLRVVAGQIVHTDCRRDFCRHKELRRTDHSNAYFSEEYRHLRSKGGFDFQKHCFFCGKSAKLQGNKRGFEVYPVRTFDFQNKVREISGKRNDVWANQVLARLEYSQDLPAAEAMYHQTCNVNFRTGKQVCNIIGI